MAIPRPDECNAFPFLRNKLTRAPTRWWKIGLCWFDTGVDKLRNSILTISAFLVLMLLAGGASDAIEDDPTNWLRLDEARERAAEDDKLLFVFVEAEWCVTCKRMKRDVSPHEEVRALMEEKYHAISIDLDSRDTVTLDGEDVTEREFARRMEVAATPTIIFMNAQDEVLGQRPGFVGAEELQAMLRYVTSDRFGEISLEEFREQYPE